MDRSQLPSSAFIDPTRENRQDIEKLAHQILLRVCDFLSFHTPATSKTKGFLNAERIALLPNGVIVINAARGWFEIR